ncbi:MAG TPA: hypothetical protein VJ890_11680, partial [Vineibacter sp.]|nr:hypothetical protein [Vineibacter sp.]
MRGMAPGIATGGTTNVGWALSASLGVHALALAAIVWGWGSPSVPHGALLMDVELVEAAAVAPGQGPGDPAPSTAVEPAPPVAQPPTPAADVAIVLPAPEATPPVQADEWRAKPAVPVEPPAAAPPAPPTPPAVK